ncbi:MAG: type II toxin-antitoxin system RelE/ParE family toxin [Planctomycetales bacterium]|nr:type II toxin-antitoxin system RelE/ParE family toxin [Planctomycetales bacterium]
MLILDEALEAFGEHLDFITTERQDPVAAARWAERAISQVESLGHMPHRCPFAPENEHRDYPIRFLRVDECLFLFTVYDDAKVVRILDFRHGRQQPRPERLPIDPRKHA